MICHTALVALDIDGLRFAVAIFRDVAIFLDKQNRGVHRCV